MIRSIVLGFLSGCFAVFSPCAFPMLPTYLSYLFSSKRSKVALDFATFLASLFGILALMGFLVSYAGSAIVSYVPLFQLLVSLIIAALGLAMVLNVKISPPSILRKIKAPGLLGLTYGAVLSSCSIPIFTSILLYAFLTSPLEGIATLISVGLGVSAVFIATTILMVEAKRIFVERLASSTGTIQRAGGLMFLAAGTYMAINTVIYVKLF